MILLAAPACFVFNRGNKSGDQSATADVPESEIALSVTNHNYLDVVVYVLHDGQRTRVGTVSGSSSTVFFLPIRLLGQGREIRLYGDAIGNDAYAVTDILVVQRGQYIEWTLETDLRRSSVGVFLRPLESFRTSIEATASAGTATVSPSHGCAIPCFVSTDETERNIPCSLSPRYRPRRMKAFGPTERASFSDPGSVSVTATYVPTSGLGVVSGL
ncbi:MAG: hypothetical protein DMD61_04455 [Gemmatimonadetes bacterium]|nr:MAG: hypothetical protein DMD61_04455 [Gemmatimonadota bacterium]